MTAVLCSIQLFKYVISIILQLKCQRGEKEHYDGSFVKSIPAFLDYLMSNLSLYKNSSGII